MLYCKVCHRKRPNDHFTTYPEHQAAQPLYAEDGEDGQDGTEGTGSMGWLGWLGIGIAAALAVGVGLIAGRSDA